MVDFGGSAPYYYYKKKKIKPDPQPQPNFSEVDWTIGEYTRMEQEQRRKFLEMLEPPKTQKQMDAIKLQKLKETLT